MAHTPSSRPCPPPPLPVAVLPGTIKIQPKERVLVLIDDDGRWRRVHVQAMHIRLLLAMLEQHAHVVPIPKERLVEALWPGETFKTNRLDVTAATLNSAVGFRLVRALVGIRFLHPGIEFSMVVDDHPPSPAKAEPVSKAGFVC